MAHYHYKARKKNKFTEALMSSWHRVHRHYEKNLGEYNPVYVYGERANVLFLSLAAKRLGYFPLMETSIERRRGRWKGNGTADLEVLTDYNTWWTIEAKREQGMFPGRNLFGLSERVTTQLGKAVKDVENNGNREGPGIGIVFVIPFAGKGREFDYDGFTDYISDLESLDADFCAVHYCRKDYLEAADEGRSAGIAIVGRYVRHAFI